jgi:hypothetical protein
MVVSVERLLSLNGLCALCELHSVLLNLYRSLSVLFSQIDSFLPRLCIVWASHEACRRHYFNYGFNAPPVLSYFPLLSLAVSSWRD